MQAEDNLGALGWRLSDGEVRALSSAADSCDARMIQNVFSTK
jgi:pyridoxine 4-dehydrogenase